MPSGRPPSREWEFGSGPTKRLRQAPANGARLLSLPLLKADNRPLQALKPTPQPGNLSTSAGRRGRMGFGTLQDGGQISAGPLTLEVLGRRPDELLDPTRSLPEEMM